MPACWVNATPFGVRTLEAALDLYLLYALVHRETERGDKKAQPTPAESDLIQSGVEPPHSKKGRLCQRFVYLPEPFRIAVDSKIEEERSCRIHSAVPRPFWPW